MPDEIKRLQNELVSIYQQGKDCGAAFEDSEIIAAYEAAIEALEKQIPRKVTIIPLIQGRKIYRCATCGYYTFDEDDDREDINYCPYCGQALDWSEADK